MNIKVIKEKVFCMVRRHKVVAFAIALGILSACANEVAPTGGAKDTEPPKLKVASPPDKTVGFTGNKIKLSFNEFIGQQGFARTLVSPPLATAPKFRVEGKHLTFVLPQPLSDSTTYTINFADDLKDLNEGNALNNFTYVFSTGAVIDSQTISGKITDALTGEPLDGIVVMLHHKDSLDGILHTRPTYFAITDKGGNYTINYVKAADYRLFALKDQNLNYLFDQPNELIGFTEMPASLKDSVPAKGNLVLFQEESKRQKLVEKTFVEPGHLLLVYSAPVKTVELKSNLDTAATFAYFSKEKDSLHFWYADPFQKQAELVLLVNDTLKDTARIKLNPLKADTSYFQGIKPLFIDNQQITTVSARKPMRVELPQGLYSSFKIFFSRPCTGINDSVGAILTINDTTKTAISCSVKVDEKTKLFAEIEFPKEEGTPYLIKVPKGYFKDIFGATNDSATFRVTTTMQEGYGMLRLKISSDDDNYRIAELTSGKSNEVIETMYISGRGQRTYSFKNLAAENYYVKVIEDSNKNGKWDTGNFAAKTQPEKIRLFKNLPELKGGWEAEFEINLSEPEPTGKIGIKGKM